VSNADVPLLRIDLRELPLMRSDTLCFLVVQMSASRLGTLVNSQHAVHVRMLHRDTNTRMWGCVQVYGCLTRDLVT
jgi:hypothetical protein